MIGVGLFHPLKSHCRVWLSEGKSGLGINNESFRQIEIWGFYRWGMPMVFFKNLERPQSPCPPTSWFYRSLTIIFMQHRLKSHEIHVFCWFLLDKPQYSKVESSWIHILYMFVPCVWTIFYVLWVVATDAVGKFPALPLPRLWKHLQVQGSLFAVDSRQRSQSLQYRLATN